MMFNIDGNEKCKSLKLENSSLRENIYSFILRFHLYMDKLIGHEVLSRVRIWQRVGWGVENLWIETKLVGLCTTWAMRISPRNGL